jgi:hypothetical protein
MEMKRTKELAQGAVKFQVARTRVRNHAEMLGPVWATKACLQPFRFTDLSDLDRENLQSDLAGFLGTGSFAAEN